MPPASTAGCEAIAGTIPFFVRARKRAANAKISVVTLAANAHRRSHVVYQIADSDQVCLMLPSAIKSSLSTGNHRPGRLALLSVPVETAPRRGNVAGARGRGFLRDNPAMGQKAQARVCPSHSPQAAELASGRSCDHHRRPRGTGCGEPSTRMDIVLDEIVQARRNTNAAKRLLTRLCCRECQPR